MPDTTRSDYTIFDHPDVIAALFHPRRDTPRKKHPKTMVPVFIPLEDGERIGGVFHAAGQKAPTILFFHGNGEIVPDYDDIGERFIRQGINFFVVDYRGYGVSTGNPTVFSMMKDCHTVFDFVKQWLAASGYRDRLVVMGRSLGSACALELAAGRRNGIAGIIIESGFAYALPLLDLMGVDTDSLGLTEDSGFRNMEKIAHCHLPLLVIHAEYDHIVPFSDGRALFDHSPAEDKQLITIRGADHNTIFYYGMTDYLSGIKGFIDNLDD